MTALASQVTARILECAGRVPPAPNGVLATMPGWTMGTEAWLLMAAWAAVMVLVVWLLVREPRSELRDEPDSILRARFARGEITEQEYRRAAATLDANPPTPASHVRDHAAHRAHQGQETRHD